MSYTQSRNFNISKAGTKPYWCLLNVRLGYSIPAYYDYAMLDWQNNVKQHKNRSFPSGMTVPVYFNWTGTVGGVYQNWGHIAVRLPSGKIWSDGKYFNSVDDLVNRYLSNGSYLGWGESVNRVRVIREATTVAQKIDGDRSRQLGFHYLGRNGQDGTKNALQSDQQDIKGKELTLEYLSSLFLSNESRGWRDGRLPKVYKERDTYKSLYSQANKQNADLKAINADLQAKLTECESKPSIPSEDTENLNKLSSALQWFKNRMGL